MSEGVKVTEGVLDADKDSEKVCTFVGEAENENSDSVTVGLLDGVSDDVSDSEMLEVG